MVNQKKKETLQQCSKRFYILKWNFLLPVESGRFHVQKCNQPTALPPAGCFFSVCVYLQLIVVAAAALPTTLVNRLLPARRVSQSVPLQRFSRIFTYRVARRCFFQAPLSFPSLPPLSFSSLLNLALFISVQHTSGWLHTTLEDYILFDVITHTQGKVKNDFHTIFFLSRLDKGIPNLFLCVAGRNSFVSFQNVKKSMRTKRIRPLRHSLSILP